MTIYELINPSDAIIFDAPDDDVATAAVTLVDDRLGWKNKTTGEEGGFIGVQAMVGTLPEDVVPALLEILSGRRVEVEEALYSFRYQGIQTSLNPIVDKAHGLAGVRAEIQGAASEEGVIK